jgi:hypothetical protein
LATEIKVEGAHARSHVKIRTTLVVNKEKGFAQIHGVRSSLTLEQCAILVCLIEAGCQVSGEALKKNLVLLRTNPKPDESARPDQIINRMPEVIEKYIERKKGNGGGYMLTVPGRCVRAQSVRNTPVAKCA